MKYDRAPEFRAEYARLSERNRQLFMEAVHKMIEASRREPGGIPHWPASLRIRQLTTRPGIFEMTWAWPDGRATFEYVSEESDIILRWRRIGGHGIFREP